MAWERRGPRSYYYRAERRDGRVRKAYYGRGVAASLASSADAELARARAGEAACLARLEADRRGPDRLLSELDVLCTALAAAAYGEAGYHRRNSGPWRRRRGLAGSTAASGGVDMSSRDQPPETIPLSGFRPIADGVNVSSDCQAGIHGGDPESWRASGDLAALALKSWVDLACGGNAGAAESLARHVEGLRAELAGDRPRPLVRLLADRVAACWLQVHHAEALLAQNRDQTGRVAKALQSALTQSQRRYLAAISGLESVRRQLGPPV
jgi:hypothetical protein